MPSGQANRKTGRATGLGLGLAFLGAALLALVLLSMTTGARPIPLDMVWSALMSADPSSAEYRIIWDLRLPRTVVGVLAGAALGLA
ncbi:MAG TPA: iron chelate uptake ABC transporter family permease subunit, partial [Devosia sp.]|nr:iron chelate uptake ABC transporter family permease subunit [Devosia sp.]